jgi:succinoglycan biosynthesis protein ExoM
MSRAEMDKSGAAVPLDLAWLGHISPKLAPHITVCVCSFRNSGMLKRLLLRLNDQVTEGLFTYSIVVADNDYALSGGAIVAKMSSLCKVPIRYCVEPRRSIALARNKAMAHSEGAFVAVIDDGQFPGPTWLLTLYKSLCEHRADGVLGAVKARFEEVPPSWLRQSGIYAGRVNPTGTMVQWWESRTGNALLKRGMVVCDPVPFRPECRPGEEQDFFRRKIEAGYRFIWSAESVVSETITPAQWKRRFILRRAISQGTTAARQSNCSALNIVKSLIAVPLYLLLVPPALLLGQMYFMRLMVRICNHSGRLLARVGLNPTFENCARE